MATRTETLPAADAAPSDQPRGRMAAEPGLWFALAGLVLLVVGVVGVVDLNDEADLMRREAGWLGISGVALLGAVALTVALVARSRSWLWLSGLASLVAVGATTLPLGVALQHRYSDRYWDFVSFDHAINSPPGWWQWFVGQTLVVECLVGAAVASVCLIIGTSLVVRGRTHGS